MATVVPPPRLPLLRNSSLLAYFRALSTRTSYTYSAESTTVRYWWRPRSVSLNVVHFFMGLLLLLMLHRQLIPYEQMLYVCIPSHVYRTILLVSSDCLNSSVNSVSLDGVARTENSGGCSLFLHGNTGSTRRGKGFGNNNFLIRRIRYPSFYAVQHCQRQQTNFWSL